ncbi:MAG: HAD family hydrolase [Planctomycetota bacterium]|jgi:HAD superfamily hydrolase (TIGR01509 family)
MPKDIKAVIFDMDGTITEPLLDFPRIKSEIGLPPDRGLLESIAAMNEVARGRAEGILLEHELAAASTSTLNPGVREALDKIVSTGLKVAVLTRNCRRGVEIVSARHDLRFDSIVTREDSAPKPDPDGILLASRQMGVRPTECILVGDYEFDMRAGRAAGAITVLFSPDGRAFPTKPDFTIGSMAQLPGIVAALEAD